MLCYFIGGVYFGTKRGMPGKNWIDSSCASKLGKTFFYCLKDLALAVYC